MNQISSIDHEDIQNLSSRATTLINKFKKELSIFYLSITTYIIDNIHKSYIKLIIERDINF